MNWGFAAAWGARHAGVLRTSLTPAGAVLRRTGRDLRRASCLIATGGVFEHSAQAGAIASAALRGVHARGGLVPPNVAVLTDSSYLLWAAGLLAESHPLAAERLVEATLVEAPRR